MSKLFLIGGLIVLAAIACWYMSTRSPATVEAEADDTVVATPQARHLVEELSRPEYLKLSREEAIELLRSRGFNPDEPPREVQQP